MQCSSSPSVSQNWPRNYHQNVLIVGVTRQSFQCSNALLSLKTSDTDPSTSTASMRFSNSGNTPPRMLLVLEEMDAGERGVGWKLRLGRKRETRCSWNSGGGREVGENVLGQLGKSLFVERVDDGAAEVLGSSCTRRALVDGREGKGCSRRGSGPGTLGYVTSIVCAIAC